MKDECLITKENKTTEDIDLIKSAQKIGEIFAHSEKTETKLESGFSNTYLKNLKVLISTIDINYMVIILVAFSQGVQGLSDLAISYLYKVS